MLLIVVPLKSMYSESATQLEKTTTYFWHLIGKLQIYMGDFWNFVAFSENLDFKTEWLIGLLKIDLQKQLSNMYIFFTYLIKNTYSS